MSTNELAPAPQTAFHPSFSDSPCVNEADIEIILQSSDGVRFRTSAALLSQWSGFFRGMIGINRPPESLRDANNDVVSMNETSKTLASLLSVITGESLPPTLSSLREAALIYEAAEKYDIKALAEYFRKQLLKLLEQDDITAMDVARKLRLENLYRTAASTAILRDIGSGEHEDVLHRLSPEFGFEFLRLHYRRTRGFYCIIDKYLPALSRTHSTCEPPCPAEIVEARAALRAQLIPLLFNNVELSIVAHDVVEAFQSDYPAQYAALQHYCNAEHILLTTGTFAEMISKLEELPGLNQFYALYGE